MFMEMKTLLYQWDFDPLIIFLSIVIIYIYYLNYGSKRDKNNICFGTGILLFLLVECSPLHFLGMHYYFSAHMISHVIILLICGPLLLISMQDKSMKSPFYKSILSVSSFLFKYSWVAWFSGVGIMWFWHIPTVFNASTHMQGPFSFIPVLHGSSMLLAGMLFSWPLFGPVKNAHLHPLLGVVYLFTACISCSLLGLLITFAPLNTFHHYMNNMHMPVSNPWNISAATDQEAAGLIMWVPCCLVYLAGCLYLLYRWFAETELPVNEKIVILKTSIIDHD